MQQPLWHWSILYVVFARTATVTLTYTVHKRTQHTGGLPHESRWSAIRIFLYARPTLSRNCLLQKAVVRASAEWQAVMAGIDEHAGVPAATPVRPYDAPNRTRNSLRVCCGTAALSQSAFDCGCSRVQPQPHLLPPSRASDSQRRYPSAYAVKGHGCGSNASQR